MPTFLRVISKKINKTAIGGLSSCFTFTPLGDTWLTSSATEGGQVIFQEKNPRWRKLVAAGRDATTAFQAETVEISHLPGFVESWRYCRRPDGLDRWGIEKISGYLNDGFSDTAVPGSPSILIDLEVDVRARNLFAKRARSAQGALRGATVMAELADTLRTIRNPARALRSSVDDYSAAARRRISKAIGRDPRGVRTRDLSKKQSQAAQRALSDSWLEAQFGWLPLISDIGSGIKAYNQFADRAKQQAVSASVSSDPSLTISFATSTSTNLNVRTEIHTSAIQQVRYYGAVRLKSDSFSTDLAEEAGFRARDFVPALWEWIPYSFLVDYFSNIGDIVEAASFPRSDMAWSARTFRNMIIRDGSRLTVATLSSNPYPLTNHTVIKAWFPSSLTITRKYIQRAKYTGSLVPELQLEIPGFRNFKKYLNIGALVHLRGMKR